jgi:hypothetical protein
VPRLLDLFCGQWGWSRPFAARGWNCIGIDLTQPAEVPPNCEYIAADVLDCVWDRGVLRVWARGCPVAGEMWIRDIDFICASSPCEQFAVHGMKHFHPDPPYPALGIKLFNHTRQLCHMAGLPYVMENVRAAQQFVGPATHHCGSFYLWGTGVGPFMPPAVKKGLDMSRDPVTGKRRLLLGRRSSHNSRARARDKAITATIPPSLAERIVDFAENLCHVHS